MTAPHTDSADELARAQLPYGFESGLVQILNEARRLSTRTIGNRELAARIVNYINDGRTRPAPETAGEADMAVYDAIAANYTAPAPAQRMSEEQERAAFAEWWLSEGYARNALDSVKASMYRHAWLARAALATESSRKCASEHDFVWQPHCAHAGKCMRPERPFGA